MDKEYSRVKKIDRSSWKFGPWDNEPDFTEWTTKVGYPAWAARLKTGAWFGIIEAPHPPTNDGSVLFLSFCHTLRDKRITTFEHNFGMVDKTDKEGIGGFVISMEHWECPGPPQRSWFRGPYKTLEDLKESCEFVAQDIFDTHKEGTYINYFDR